MTKDELWEKYGNEVLFGADMQVSEDAFFAALTEYGNEVRREAVKVCNRPKPECCGRFVDDDHSTSPVCCGNLDPGEYMDGPDCAAAIEKMPLP